MDFCVSWLINNFAYYFQYEGVANDDHIPFLMDLNNQGSQLSPYFDIPMPQQFIVPGRREHLYIPGSNTAYIHVYGKFLYTELPSNVILILIYIFNDSIYHECNLLFAPSKSTLVLILCMHLMRHTPRLYHRTKCSVILWF